MRYLPILFLLIISSCNLDQSASKKESIELIQKYLTERSPNAISIDDDIVFRFNNQFELNQDVAQSAFKVRPHVDGELIWADDYTLVFDPGSNLKYGQAYEIEIQLNELIKDSREEDGDLLIRIATKPLSIRLNSFEHHMKAIGQDVHAIISGNLVLNQTADVKSIEQIVEVTPKIKNLKIDWDHSENGINHTFAISGLRQQVEEQKIKVKLQGGHLFSNLNLSKDVIISGEKEFEFDEVVLKNSPSRYISVYFTQPLESSQDLRGLVRINEESDNIRTLIEGNELLIYPSGDLSGTFTLDISKQILSFRNNNLPTDIQQALSIEPVKPQLRLANSGVIVPGNSSFTFPFEAINIDSVDLEVFKIYEQNVLQFLQDNALSGEYSLDQVGKIVHRDKLYIGDSGSTLNQWRQISFDLNDYINSDPNSIYQIRIGFRPTYVVKNCDSAVDDYIPVPEDGSIMEYRYYSYSDWDNPCAPSFYNPGNFVKRNVLLSNTSAIIKRTQSNQYHIAVVRISDGTPLNNALIKFYNYQQQPIGELRSDSNGFAVLKTKEKAAFSVITHEEGVAYINILDANSNSLADFNTGGKRKKNGIDAFVYADRGVYRPGDTIYIHAIIEDAQMPLPVDHPVSFTLKDPEGVIKFKQSTSTHTQHIYNFTIPTDANDITGSWSGMLTVGSNEFGKGFSIETIKPNRLRLNLEKDDRILYADRKSRRIGVRSSWLHGAPASNLRSKIDVQWATMNPNFNGYSDYKFADPARRLEQNQVTIFDGNLDKDGFNSFELQLDSNAEYPAMLKANVTSRVFEKGGDFSENYSNLEVSPYSNYVGISIPKNDWGYASVKIGDNASVDAVVLDSKGQPAPFRNLTIGVYDISWQWWYYRGQRYRIYELNSDSHTKAIQKMESSTDATGRAHIPIDTEELEYGRKLIRICDTKSGHCTGDFFYASGWRSSISNDERNSLSKLSFQTDKDSYDVGEEVSLSIPSEMGSKILISIENEDDVLFQEWIEGRQGSVEYNFTADGNMAPNVYAHISLVQPYHKLDNNLPIRMYGVVPIMINDSDKILAPEIITAAKYEPEKDFAIKIKESEGREMVYTIAIVDEGLLDLTNFKTPDPFNHFYAKRSLRIKTWDVYNDILYGLNGKPDKIVSVGGDGDGDEGKGEKKAIRFKPVVFSAGPFILMKNQVANHTFTMPNYIGSVRTMVIARDEDAFGKVEQTVPVKTPLMVLPTVPRVLSQEEKLKIPISVFAMEAGVKDVSVTVSTSSNIKILESTKSVVFEKPGEQLVYFDAMASDQIGIAKIDVSARSGDNASSQHIEVDIRNPNPIETTTQTVTIAPGDETSFSVERVGVAGTNTGVVELSRIPNIQLADRVNYLVRYPYGCLEQTTSAVFVQLYLKELTDYVSDSEIDRNIHAGIKRILKMKHSSGGFKYWPGTRARVNEWTNSYAGHFLIEAKNKGYYVSNNVLESWARDQKRRAANFKQRGEGDYWRSQSLKSQSYRLYTLALYGTPDLSAMNLLRTNNEVPNTGKYLLAAAYAMNGKMSIALDLIEDANTEVNDYRDMGFTYSSELSDMSLIAQALSYLDRSSQSAELTKRIAEKLNSGKWYSTQSIAMGLMSVGKFVENMGSETISATINYNNQNQEVNYEKPIFTMQIRPDNLSNNSLTITNDSDEILFASLQLSGQKSIATVLQNSANESHVALAVNYKNMDGNNLDVSSIEQGTDFIAEITIKNLNTRGPLLEELALTQIFPSGWEIRSGRLNKVGEDTQSNYEYRDIRDDRIHTFFDLGTSKTYKVLLNAAYVGSYFLPPVHVEAMYDKSVSAASKGRMVEVIGRSK